jgi:sigma-B regulation protein RsbU (phosphoserine phosphatase)
MSAADSPASANLPRPRWLPSLRLLVTLIVVLPIAAVAAALVTISVITSRRIAEQLGEQLVADATGPVASEVRRYIGEAVRVSDLYTRRITTGKLSTTNLASWEPVMFDDLLTSPNIASICFGTPAGDATYLQRGRGRLELGLADGAKNCDALEFPADSTGRVDRTNPSRQYRYDPRARPWYVSAMEKGEPTWTPVYFWFGNAGDDQETGAGYTRTIRAGDKLAGVLTIDVTLGAISEFLRKQSFSSSGAIFIVDDNGVLVAASQGNVNSSQGTRLKLARSESAAARAVAKLYPTTSPSSSMVSNRTAIGEEIVRVSEFPLHPYTGVNWRIITVLPESAFLTPAWHMQRRAILLACIAVAGAMVLGIVFSRRLSQPLMQLTQHAARIGGGDLRARLHLGSARELHQLAEETNRMAAGLRQRMELEQSLEIATHVQQSLLPKCTPTLRGLDIAAHSRYCDSTGGDYYDFIDIAGLPDDRAFIAVGDVMGHGIGSALVMATARAAVRSSAAASELTLGQLMTRVNDVLSSDPHGLFMTLALIVVEPKNARVRWASAGHDPVIAYNPAMKSFAEFEGGDIPLGINSGYPYQDFEHKGIAADWILFAGTDGVWEARNEAGEMYEKHRVREAIEAHHTESAKQISQALERSLAQFVGRGPVLDDITFVVVKIMAEESEKDSGLRSKEIESTKGIEFTKS